MTLDDSCIPVKSQKAVREEIKQKIHEMKSEIVYWEIRHDRIFNTWELTPWVRIVSDDIEIYKVYEYDISRFNIFIETTDPIEAFTKGYKLITKEMKKK